MDIVELDGRALGGLETIVAGVKADQYGAPTPCTEWTVKDLCVHIVAVNRKYTEIARGHSWEPGAPDVDLGDELTRAYHDTIEPLLNAWQQPGVLHRPLDSPAGRKPAELALWVHLRETLVHGWDLAAATRQPACFDDEVVKASLAHNTHDALAARSWFFVPGASTSGHGAGSSSAPTPPGGTDWPTYTSCSPANAAGTSSSCSATACVSSPPYSTSTPR